MNIILFDDQQIRQSLLPLTYTRPVANLRVGILTINEKWEKELNTSVSYITEEYLSKKYPLQVTNDNLLINGALCPDNKLVEQIKKLQNRQALVKENVILAARSTEAKIPNIENLRTIEYTSEVTLITAPWNIYKKNREQIEADFIKVTEGRKSADVNDSHTIIYGKEKVFIEEGAKIRAAVINAEAGSVYIGKNTEIQEGALIRGAFALCEGAVLSMGAKIKGDTSIGPYSKIGGEVSNSVIQGYTNKGHEGFLGNSVLGEWCNLGADTNVSNLKNNYSDVKIWSYSRNRFVDTGETFCGLIMGDHSKSGINTMFNTGTVVGVSANIFGSGFPRNFIPSFAWGGSHGFTTYKIDKVFEVAEKVMERRNRQLDNTEREIINHIYDTSEDQRFWDKK